MDIQITEKMRHDCRQAVRARVESWIHEASLDKQLIEATGGHGLGRHGSDIPHNPGVIDQAALVCESTTEPLEMSDEEVDELIYSVLEED